MFEQNVEKFLTSMEALFKSQPKYADRDFITSITKPEKIIEFDVDWSDGAGNSHTNHVWRVQFNNILGPYKGGMRFHASVNVDILKSLAFEQMFKNSLTTLDLGGAKGGSDFDPHGKSDAEVIRFCEALMKKLAPYIGPKIDVPAGDIGVGAREITAMLNTYLSIYGDSLQNRGVLTGKKIEDGGSLCRTEATGYGLVYFAEEHLLQNGESFDGKDVLISGSGNVATYACEKAQQLGANVLTMSDSLGYVFDSQGIDLDLIKQIKQVERGRISEYAKRRSSAIYHEGKRPWAEKADIVLPCATQNEIELDDAKLLANNNVMFVAEGSNLSTSEDAYDVLCDAGIDYFPGKASNAGGVTVSGFEMQQNALGEKWSFEDVDLKLKEIMKKIYHNCDDAASKYATPGDFITGSNIAAYIRLFSKN